VYKLFFEWDKVANCNFYVRSFNYSASAVNCRAVPAVFATAGDYSVGRYSCL